MAGTRTGYTFKEAKAKLAEIQMTITSKEGEYRVNFVGGKEATASYDTDLTSSIGTAVAMRKHADGH